MEKAVDSFLLDIVTRCASRNHLASTYLEHENKNKASLFAEH